MGGAGSEAGWAGSCVGSDDGEQAVAVLVPEMAEQAVDSEDELFLEHGADWSEGEQKTRLGTNKGW